MWLIDAADVAGGNKPENDDPSVVEPIELASDACDLVPTVTEA
jgi:hypothetical protein